MNEQLGMMGPPVADMEAALAGGNPQPERPIAPTAAQPAPATAEKQPFRWSGVDGGWNLSPEWKLRANARLAKRKGFWENVSVKPFLGTAEDVYSILEMNQIGAKIGLGKASREETEKYYDWVIDRGLRENSFWGSIGELGSGSVEFGVEMAVGGGIATGAAKKFAGAALAKAAEKATSRFMSKLAVGAAAAGVTTGLQEAVPSAINAGMGRGFTGGAWTRNMLDVTLGAAEFTDEEKVRLVDDMNAAVAIAYERGGSLLKGFALQAADVATESLGGPLSKVTPISHLNGLFGAVTRKLAGRLPKREFFKAMADAAQFQGPFVEVLEEYIAEATKVAIGNGKTLPEAMSELTGNLPEMLTTFALPGLGGAAATRVSDAARLAMGQQVDGRQGVAGGLSEQRPEPGATGAPGPQGPGAPTPVGPEVKRRALENYARGYEETYKKPLPAYDEVSPKTAQEAIAARVLEAGGAPYVFIKSRSKGGAKTRGFYDPETGAIVVDVDDPFVARTAHHELAHAMWARWSPEKRQEFVSSLDEADATFLPEALATWRESAGDVQASEQLEQNESVATGAEAIAPAMEFLATPRGAKLAEMAEAARPGRARGIFEFGADFLRALAGRAPQAPTTALRAFERALSAEKGSGKQVATIAKRYTAAFEEASKAFREAPATPSSFSGEDVYSGLDLSGMLQETQATEPGPMDNWTAPQTGSAVWSNAGRKTRVEVVGRAGLARDGSELARIRGTTVGVPYSQLKFDEPPAAAKDEEPESKKRDRGGKRAKAQAEREAAEKRAVDETAREIAEREAEERARFEGRKEERAEAPRARVGRPDRLLPPGAGAGAVEVVPSPPVKTKAERLAEKRARREARKEARARALPTDVPSPAPLQQPTDNFTTIEAMVESMVEPEAPAPTPAVAPAKKKPRAKAPKLAGTAALLRNLSRLQTRYQGNKREFLSKNAEKVAALFDSVADRVEMIADLYAGGGTYGSSLAGSGIFKNLKVLVVNEIDPLRNARLRAAIAEGGAFIDEWETQPVLRELRASLDRIRARYSSNTPVKDALDLAADEVEASKLEYRKKNNPEVFQEFVAYQERIKALPLRARIAVLAVRDTMFSAYSVALKRPFETAREDSNRIRDHFAAVRERGIRVEILQADSLDPSISAKVSSFGRGIVLADPPYRETTTGSYSAGGVKIDFASAKTMNDSLTAIAPLANRNLILYHNKDTSSGDVRRAIGEHLGKSAKLVPWAREKGPEILGIVDGLTKGGDAGGNGGSVRGASGRGGAGGGPAVLGGPGGNGRGQADAGTAKGDRGAGGVEPLFARNATTIEVDGVDRPRENSDGRPIAAGDDALRAFWRWFGDSRVVDERGRPLVVYRGDTTRGVTQFRSSFEAGVGIFWTTSEDVADTFTYPREYGEQVTVDEDGNDIEPGDVTRAYLRILNLATVPGAAAQRFVDDTAYQSGVLKRLTTSEWDGIRVPNVMEGIGERRMSDNFVVLKSTQIKSATSNAGTFDPANPDIRFARRKGGRYKLRFHSALGLNEIADQLADAHAGPTVQRDPRLGMTPDQAEAVQEAGIRARVEGDQTRLGRPGLNNPANTPAGRAVVRGVDELQSAKHVVHTLEQVAAEAEESLRTGGVERRRALERKLASGAQLSDTETVEAVRVFDELVARWTKSQKKEDFRNAALWGQALRAARTEQGRALGATRRQGLSAAATLAEELVAPTRSQERRLRAIRRRMAQVAKESPGAVTTPKLQLGGIFAPSPAQKAASRRVSFDSFDRDRGRMVSPAVWAELVSAEQAIIAEAQASAQRGIDAVLAAGYTIQDMQDLWLDPVEGRPVRAAFGAAKAGWSEKAFEFRYASILSGPRTHLKNNAGNAANFLVEGIFQPTMEGLVNAFMRDPSQASLDEGLTFLRGAKRTMRTAVSNAWLAWRGEMPVLEVGLKEQGVNIGAYRSRADALEADRISPAVGNAVLGVGLRRMSLSLLLAADEFWKTLAVGGQSLALAGRIARSEGLHGAAKDRRISALLADKTHPLWIEAVDKARKITFQDEGGRASQAITNAAYSVRSAIDTATPYLFVGTTLIPFIGTSVRLFATVLRRSPASMALFAARVLRGKYRDDTGAFVMDAADAAIAGLIAGTVWAMMDEDEDGMPSITGSRPSNRGESEMMQRLGIPPLSVRIGGRWHQFRDIEPLSTSIGLMVDGIAEWKRTGSLGAAQAVLSSAFEQAKDKTFIQTLGDLYELTQQSTNKAGKVADMLSYSFITPWMPNLIRQPLRALDDNTRARVRKQEGESIFTTTAKDLPYQLLPLEAIAPAPKFDLWGRPMLKEATQTPSSAVVRLLSPTLPQGRKGEQMKADLFLRKYNERVRAGELGDEDVAFPLSPSYTFEMDGEVKRWSNEEYAELTQRAGEIAARGVAELIDQGSLSLEEPTKEQLRVVQNVISAARRGVAGELKVRRQGQGPALRASP